MIERLNMHRSFLDRVSYNSTGTINFSLFYEQPRKSGKRGRLYAGRGKHLLRTSNIYIYMYRCTFRESMNRALSHRFSPAILSRHFTFLFVPFQLSRYNWFPGCIDARWNSRAYLIAYFPFDVKCSFVARKFAFHHYIRRDTPREYNSATDLSLLSKESRGGERRRDGSWRICPVLNKLNWIYLILRQWRG